MSVPIRASEFDHLTSRFASSTTPGHAIDAQSTTVTSETGRTQRPRSRSWTNPRTATAAIAVGKPRKTTTRPAALSKPPLLTL